MHLKARHQHHCQVNLTLQPKRPLYKVSSSRKPTAPSTSTSSSKIPTPPTALLSKAAGKAPVGPAAPVIPTTSVPVAHLQDDPNEPPVRPTRTARVPINLVKVIKEGDVGVKPSETKEKDDQGQTWQVYWNPDGRMQWLMRIDNPGYSDDSDDSDGSEYDYELCMEDEDYDKPIPQYDQFGRKQIVGYKPPRFPPHGYDHEKFLESKGMVIPMYMLEKEEELRRNPPPPLDGPTIEEMQQ
ncbi:hypothetical protein K474DRAFT_1679881 [Panus rudis PR-1116 ss-1]|nr:hypothetical protein K474DRAFT_1679881 [Panus rudis PR-1116 ss-1]